MQQQIEAESEAKALLEKLPFLKIMFKDDEASFNVPLCLKKIANILELL